MMEFDELEQLIDKTLADMKGTLLSYYTQCDEWQEGDEDYIVTEKDVLKDIVGYAKHIHWLYYDEEMI